MMVEVWVWRLKKGDFRTVVLLNMTGLVEAIQLLLGGIYYDDYVNLYANRNISVTDVRYRGDILFPIIIFFAGANNNDLISMDHNNRPHRAWVVNVYLRTLIVCYFLEKQIPCNPWHTHLYRNCSEFHKLNNSAIRKYQIPLQNCFWAVSGHIRY